MITAGHLTNQQVAKQFTSCCASLMSPKGFGFDGGDRGQTCWGVRDGVDQRHPLRQQQAKKGRHDDAAHVCSGSGSRLDGMHQAMVLQGSVGAVGRRSKLTARPSTKALS